jgi:DNA gyrase/topoisomerase IV subunit B
LLTEASKLGKPSIFPNSGGISEFFPEGYEFKFNQFDYDDLKRKIKNLYYSEKYYQVGIENKRYIDNYLEEEKLIEDFMRYIEL